MMYVHSFFIAFGVFLAGLLCLTSSHELPGTTLGKKISLGLGVFWAYMGVIFILIYSI
jgi:hypothetical protein